MVSGVFFWISPFEREDGIGKPKLTVLKLVSYNFLVWIFTLNPFSLFYLLTTRWLHGNIQQQPVPFGKFLLQLFNIKKVEKVYHFLFEIIFRFKVLTESEMEKVLEKHLDET